MSDEKIMKSQCQYVFDGGFCCDGGDGHAGEHTTNERALRNLERSFWVPEHPTLPMYRATKPSQTGKLGEVEHLLTASIHHAMQFATREECEAWIAANPHPAFIARGHSIVAAPVGRPDGSLTTTTDEQAAPAAPPVTDLIRVQKVDGQYAAQFNCTPEEALEALLGLVEDARFQVFKNRLKADASRLVTDAAIDLARGLRR